MPDIERNATAVWEGDLRGGKGHISTQSSTLKDTEFTFVSRFEDGRGTTPEELLAAAHAGCYSMALANHLSKKGHKVHDITTRAICTLRDGKITKFTLETHGKVEGIDESAFEAAAKETESGCIVSNALRSVPIELHAKLSK